MAFTINTPFVPLTPKNATQSHDNALHTF